MNRANFALAGQFLLNALSGRLGVPMMVLGYLSFAVCLLAYVSTQVYTSSLMEDVGARKRTELALKERIGVLTARYATMTSKSRVSSTCQRDLGLIESTSADVLRVSVEGATPTDTSRETEVRVDDVLDADLSAATREMGR